MDYESDRVKLDDGVSLIDQDEIEANPKDYEKYENTDFNEQPVWMIYDDGRTPIGVECIEDAMDIINA
jgi:hypothetical protein